MNKIGSLLREILSEPGHPEDLSWGRVSSSIALLFALGWITWHLHINHTLPPLEGLTGFVTAPYAANKVTTAAAAFKK